MTVDIDLFKKKKVIPECFTLKKKKLEKRFSTIGSWLSMSLKL